MRITQKLGVLVAVPLCAVSGFGALTLVGTGTAAIQAEHLWTLMNAADAAGSLAAQLQSERSAVTAYLTTPPSAGSISAWEAQTTKTDTAIDGYRALASRLQFAPPDTAALLGRITGELTALPVLRAQIRAGAAPALSAVVFQYRIVIADLLAFQGGVAQAGGASPDAADAIRAASVLAQASESSSQEEADVLRLVIGTPLTPNAQQDLTVARTGYASGLESFAETAPADSRARPQQALAGPAVTEASQLEDLVARTPVGSRVRIAPETWVAAMSARLEALDGVREDMDRRLLASIAAQRDHERVLAGIEAASVAGTMLLAVMMSLRLGRPMIKGLRHLQDSAHAVAYQHLPAAVETLRTGRALADRTPEQFADEVGSAVSVKGDDEIAAVGRAFNTVHREAVRTAADMELLRSGVGAAFVALARRGERLTGALTAELDKAEQDEQDPDRLARLFVLDHLAARMSRNNESLLVLGGEGTARLHDRGASLLDVLRGAMGRIEHYSRVQIGTVDASIVVAPSAIDHLLHLCAELMDNATVFSAPGSAVTVQAGMLADRVILQIADRGIGLTPLQQAELNSRLSAPRTADVAAVRAMGLTVTARLASWHGIAVELRARPEGGTIAEVTLPSALYRIDSRQQQVYQPAATPAPKPPLSPWLGGPVPNARRRERLGEPTTRPPVTTSRGLPVRVPLSHLPVTPPKDDTPDADDLRDSAQVSSVLAAYARGIGADRPTPHQPTTMTRKF